MKSLVSRFPSCCCCYTAPTCSTPSSRITTSLPAARRKRAGRGGPSGLLLALAGCTAAAALESELVADALVDTAGTLHITPLFLGVIVLALVGTIADVFAAVWFAHKDRMGLVMGICIGSSIQIALVVAPLLVILSWLIGHPMTLVFHNPIELFAIAGTTSS